MCKFYVIYEYLLSFDNYKILYKYQYRNTLRAKASYNSIQCDNTMSKTLTSFRPLKTIF